MRCLLCQNLVEHSVLSFCGEVICGDCEAVLMESTVDQPQYEHIVRVFKMLWQQQFSADLSYHPLESDNF